VPSAESWFSNLSIVSATTTNANDSIKITSADGSALSTGNSGFVDLPGATAGQTTRFKVTADVTILTTGAHWGHGTTGDITGGLLRVLAINDNGTLRWGIALLGGRNTLLTTDTNATQTNINLPEEVLCTAAVASATNSCRELGFIRSNFDDTGGAAEDLWANQTGISDVYTGITADGYWQPWNPVQAGGTTPIVTIARWSQIRLTVFISFDIGITSNAVTWTATTPLKANTNSNHICAALTTDNAAVGDVGLLLFVTDSVTQTLKREQDQTWTAAGAKRMVINGSYEVGPAASILV
jgi:hypothetical protein